MMKPLNWSIPMSKPRSFVHGLVLVILVATHTAPALAQPGERKEGTILGIDQKKKTVELGWVVTEIERIPIPGGTKAQPNDIFFEKAVGTQKATYPLSEKVAIRFTKAPTFVDAAGKERKATGPEYQAYRGNGNITGFKASSDVALKNLEVTLVFKKDEVVMILVNGSETIKPPEK